MPKYGQVAILATTLIHHYKYSTPQEAWNAATNLGLCEAGLIRGVLNG